MITKMINVYPPPLSELETGTTRERALAELVITIVKNIWIGRWLVAV